MKDISDQVIKKEVRKNKDDCFTTNSGFDHYEFSDDYSPRLILYHYIARISDDAYIKSGSYFFLIHPLCF